MLHHYKRGELTKYETNFLDVACDSDVALKFKETIIKINLFNITLELFVEIDISEELFIFFSAYTQKGVKVRLLIFVYESQSTFHS